MSCSLGWGDQLKGIATLAGLAAIPVVWQKIKRDHALHGKGDFIGRVTQVAIHPVKSMKAVPRQSIELDEDGAVGDRRVMVVDPKTGNFLSQRQVPRLALISATLTDSGDTLALDAPGQKSALVINLSETPVCESGDAVTTAKVWGQSCGVVDLGDDAALWVSDNVDRPVRLVRWDKSQSRIVDPRYVGGSVSELASGGGRVAFPDGFPLLVTTEQSLADLNARLDDAVPMRRFRPNIVVDACVAPPEDAVAAVIAGYGEAPKIAGAMDEETWKIVRFVPRDGSRPPVTLEFSKACGRCVMTTVDTDAGERVSSGQPLATLKEYKSRDNSRAPIFGVNAVVVGKPGEVRVGDDVYVITRRSNTLVPV